MNSYVTWGDLVWLIVAFIIGDVLAHIGSDLVKLAIARRKRNTRQASLARSYSSQEQDQPAHPGEEQETGS
jgi:hypothetical protein